MIGKWMGYKCSAESAAIYLPYSSEIYSSNRLPAASLKAELALIRTTEVSDGASYGHNMAGEQINFERF